MKKNIKNFFENQYLEYFFTFSSKKISYSIVFFFFLSVFSSLLDISVIFYITNIVFSITKGIPITHYIFNQNLVIDFTKSYTYIIFFCLCTSAYLIKVYVNLIEIIWKNPKSSEYEFHPQFKTLQAIQLCNLSSTVCIWL